MSTHLPGFSDPNHVVEHLYGEGKHPWHVFARDFDLLALLLHVIDLGLGRRLGSVVKKSLTWW